MKNYADWQRWPDGMHKNCIRKKAYNKQQAIQQAHRSEKIYRRSSDTGPPIVAYKCEHCKKWHIGHQKRYNRRSKGAKNDSKTNQ